MEIEPKPVITPVSNASFTLEPVLGREMAPHVSPSGRGFLKGPLPKSLSWCGLCPLRGTQTTETPTLLPRNGHRKGRPPIIQGLEAGSRLQTLFTLSTPRGLGGGPLWTLSLAVKSSCWEDGGAGGVAVFPHADVAL